MLPDLAVKAIKEGYVLAAVWLGLVGFGWVVVWDTCSTVCMITTVRR